MSDTATTDHNTRRNDSVECIDPENIVIALPRRSELSVSGGVRTVPFERRTPTEAIDEDTEPVLAD